MKIRELVISNSISSNYWTGSFTLESISDYSLLKEGDSLTLDVLGQETFEVIVTAKVKTRDGPGNISLKIDFASKTINKSDAYEKSFDYENNAELISVIANNIATPYNLSWNTIDWILTGKLLSFESTNSINIINTITKEIGAFLNTDYSGDFEVNPIYKVNTDKLYSINPDHLFNDSDDIFYMSEQRVKKTGINKVRVLNKLIEENSKNDILEFEQDEEIIGQGYISVYPNPWRIDFILEINQVPHSTFIKLLRIEDVPLTEEVEFKNGEGSVSKPIFSITNITWKSKQLLNVNFEVGESTITFDTTINEGYGLANIEYNTKRLYFQINTSVSNENIQILLKD